MADYTVVNLKQVEDMAPTANLAPNLEARFARGALGLAKSGVSLFDVGPGFKIPWGHRHRDQEEVYIVLRGSGEIEIDGERHRLDPETMVRVASGTKRKVYTGDDPIRMVIVGGVPGQAYEAPEVTQLGAPDPGIPGQ